MGGKKKKFYKKTIADSMSPEADNYFQKLSPKETPRMKAYTTESQKRIAYTLILSKDKKQKNPPLSIWRDKETWRYFENVDFITIQKAKELAMANNFTLELWYKGKKLLGYLNNATIPRNRRIFKIKKNDRLLSTDGILRFCDGEKFIHYDEKGEEKRSASV